MYRIAFPKFRLSSNDQPHEREWYQILGKGEKFVSIVSRILILFAEGMSTWQRFKTKVY